MPEDSPPAAPVTHRAPISRYRDRSCEVVEDRLAIEEPLEILLHHASGRRTLSITMRTPGQDADLVRGFLFAEGIIDSLADIEHIEPWGPRVPPYGIHNTLVVTMADAWQADEERLRRNFVTYSGCGICGKTALEALGPRDTPPLVWDAPPVTAELLCRLPQLLRDAQDHHHETGGTHAVGLFDAQGQAVAVCEDIGRHNAMDKLTGILLARGQVPASNHLVTVSGRASFELVQKALAAGIPLFVSIGAPSSLAVTLAAEHDMSLVGFLKRDSFNIYHDAGRVAGSI